MYTNKEIEEAKAFILDRVNAEIYIQDKLDEALLWAAKEIANIAYIYKIKASLFRFSANKQLNREVEAVIAKLREMLYEYTEAVATKTDKENKYNLIPYINSKKYGKTVKEKINTYTNRYKYELEAFIAAGILWGYSINKLLANIQQDITAPYNNKLFKDSVKKGGMIATRIKSNGISYGQGHAISARNQLNILLRNTVASTWMYAYGQQAQENGATGFYSYRGSTYPCALCDDMVGYHSIEDYQGLWHPNCRCFFIFVNY